MWVEQLRYPEFRFQSTRTPGHYPAMSLSEARAKAARWYGWVKAGIDPEVAETEQKAEADAARRAAALKKAHTEVPPPRYGQGHSRTAHQTD